jgi:molybdopterin molybdotransferase
VPVRLPVVDDLPAGRHREQPFPAGTTVRIMTGAPVPPGTGGVVQVEWTDAGTDIVAITRAVAAGANIRRAGEDVVAGQQLLPAGVVLTAQRIGLLAATGHPQVRVHPRPRVLVLGTGSELVEPGVPLGPGQIYESNAHLLQAAVTESGGVALRPGLVPDEPAALLEVLGEYLPQVDLVVTSGGVSAGAYDTVKEVLAGSGTVTFTKVAMQPGMPQGCGRLRDGRRWVPIITLPGNPVSSYVSFEVFVRPVLRLMRGLEELFRPPIVATARTGWRCPPGKRQYARAFVTILDGQAMVEPAGGQRSHFVADLAACNALAVVDEQVEHVRPGDRVTCWLLDG